MDQYDSSYIGSYSTELTGRLYTSRKFSRFGLKDRGENFKLIYKTNENQILGFGATYKFFTLNIGLNFPFVNNDDDIYGESRYLDVQSQAYFRRYMIELWLSLYKGYYIDQPADRLSNWPTNNEFPMRPEMVNTTFGGTILRILNPTKFSYRAAFVQDEWQKRSAGSFLVGAQIFFVFTDNDSTLVPVNINSPNFFEGYDFKESTIFTLGVSGGYAHTFVLRSHYFLTLSAVGAAGIGGSRLTAANPNEQDLNEFALNFTGTGRIALGYNSRVWYIGASYIGLFLRNDSPIDKSTLLLDAGRVRFNLAKRFKLKKEFKIPILEH